MSEAPRAPMPGAEGLVEPLRSRWSPSVFDDEHRLPAEHIRTLLHAAQWAPSHGNLQPWRFLVAERGDETHGVLVPHLSRGNSGWVPRASLVLLAAAKVEAEPEDEKSTDPALSLYALGLAGGFLTVQAHAMGLHVHQFQGFDKQAVAERLGVPSYWTLVVGLAVGVRGDAADVSERDAQREERQRSRRPLREIAYAGRWGRSWPGASGDL